MPRFSNRYSSRRRGRYNRPYSKRDNTGFLRAMLIILPVLIIGVLVCGGYFAYKDYVKENPPAEYEHSVVTEQLYTEAEAALLTKVVNSSSQLSSDFVPNLQKIGGVSVNNLLVECYNKMISDAASDGLNIKLVSGYISYDEQKNLNTAEQERLKAENGFTSVKAEAEAKKTVPQAGCSERQTGLLIELSVQSGENFSESREYQWLIRNANTYGFIQRYPQNFETQTGTSFNPSLFRFIGEENALKIRIFGMCLEEYSVYLDKN